MFGSITPAILSSIFDFFSHLCTVLEEGVEYALSPLHCAMADAPLDVIMATLARSMIESENRKPPFPTAVMFLNITSSSSNTGWPIFPS